MELHDTGWRATNPELIVFARSEIDPAISNAFLYSEIVQADRDAFTAQWSAVEVRTTMTRMVSSSVLVEQYEFSFPAYFSQSSEPTI